MAYYSGYSSPAPFAKLKALDGADPTAPYLEKLREYAKQVKPVFRYSCPPGYTHDNPGDGFPDDTAKIGKLWFMDKDGHACKPTAGWGTQPALALNDEYARMYRENEDKLTTDKIYRAKNELMCSPCGRSGLSKKSVSCAADSLISTISDIKSTDSAGMVGDVFTLGGGGMSHVSASSEAPSLLGGGKVSEETKCALGDMVKGLTPGERAGLQAAAQGVVTAYTNKLKTKAASELECLVSPDSDRMRCLSPPLRRSVVRLKNMLPDQAVSCSQASYMGESVSGCSPSASCLSSARKIDELENMKKKVKEVEPKKRLYKDTMKVFMKYRSEVRSCGGVAGLTADDERKYKIALASAYHKYHRSLGNPKTDDEIVKKVDPIFADFKKCAPVCGPEGCPPGGDCVSSTCGSSVCIPKELSQMKKDVREASKLGPIVDDMSDWWSKFYAEQGNFRKY
jgi:hypothetical protein